MFNLVAYKKVEMFHNKTSTSQQPRYRGCISSELKTPTKNRLICDTQPQIHKKFAQWVKTDGKTIELF